MRVYVGSTCDISMLGSSILPAMNEARLDSVCVSMCVVPVIYLCWGLAFCRP